MRKLIVAITALLAACGTPSISVDNYAEAVREAYCNYYARCGAIESVETCGAANLGTIGLIGHLSATERAAIDIGKAIYHGDHAASCLDALATRSCDVTSRSNRVAPDACRQIVTGTLHADAACAEDPDCLSGSCALVSCNQGCCTGTCTGDAVPPRAKAGEPCDPAACDDASFCDHDAQMCVALKSNNAFCGGSDECNYGLDCLPGGSCGALPPPGSPCTVACRDTGTHCSSSSGTCVKVALAGQACATSIDCSPFYTCDPTKHCSPGLALGTPCSTGQLCAGDLAFCDAPLGESAGVCAQPKPDGAPCVRNSDCESTVCDPVTVLCAPEPVCP